MASIVLPNPFMVPFERWAAVFIEQISQYNVEQQPTEDSWKEWAMSVVSNPALKLQGLPVPHLFNDWRSWAVRVNETML